MKITKRIAVTLAAAALATAGFIAAAAAALAGTGMHFHG